MNRGIADEVVAYAELHERGESAQTGSQRLGAFRAKVAVLDVQRPHVPLGAPLEPLCERDHTCITYPCADQPQLAL